MIGEFQGPHRWLSNFAPVTVEFEGVPYPSVEHAYQAAKTKDRDQRATLLTLTAGQAKRAVRAFDVRPDWDDCKLEIMEALLRQKFAQEPYRTKLRETGRRMIVEGNNWGDTFWGMCRGAGTNHLGRLIMQIREEQYNTQEIA
jgi:ribA/ribD-fused uncharacterized protein